MILVRVPLRISLAGGGTDSPLFFRHWFGAVVSFTIKRYVYVILNQKFDGLIRASYSRAEYVQRSADLKHDIIRESLLWFDVHSGIEVVTVADIPGTGTGLGSSSALAVGLAMGLTRYVKGDLGNTPEMYADTGYLIERDMANHPVGKQDHYAAAYGGLNYFQFNQDGSVKVEPISLNPDEQEALESRMYLMYTGRGRDGNEILRQQEENLTLGIGSLAEDLRNMAVRLRDDMRQKDFSSIGEYLDANWQIKRQLAYGITNDWIDQKYEQARAAGAEGGKILGAGGGGFFLFWAKPGMGPTLEKATRLKHIPFEIEPEGARVLYG